ncbi:hypothetical protein [Saccharibacillus endophyticus]|uniref:DUF4309 domain-containing protein n=1 Tax=Saccharibacillus endophyticus TaxID=2060666 RepID=A0ABQ1ZNT3_9BACL|nr:hypothetical protein [Saccharibacillus endophyticus]GGH70230.1 hypothetical protein GCM10007362_06130 [Saccharibacillus endophyticus]
MNKTTKLLLSTTLAGTAIIGTSWTSSADAASAAVTNPKTVTSQPAQKSNPYEAAGIDDPAAFHTFFIKLQQAVAKNDKKAVASMISYPLNVNTNGKTYKFQTPARFIAKYDSIMTPEVKRTLGYAIEEDLFANWQGVMVGNGQLWISQFDGKIAVYAVNK